MTRSALYVPAILLLSSLPCCGLVSSSEGLNAVEGVSEGEACEIDSVAPAIAEAIERSANENGMPDPLAVTELEVREGGLLGVECLENLTRIYLHGTLAEDDIVRLVDLRKLSSLYWTDVSTIEPLRLLPNLRLLGLNTGPLHDLSPLEDLVGLETLQVVGLWELASFEPIGKLLQLKSLHLFDVLLSDDAVPDYSFLENLTLESLSLFAIDGLVDFSNVPSERLSSLALWDATPLHLERLGPPASSSGNVELWDEYGATDREVFAQSLCPLGWCIQTYTSETRAYVELCQDTCDPADP